MSNAGLSQGVGMSPPWTTLPMLGGGGGLPAWGQPQQGASPGGSPAPDLTSQWMPEGWESANALPYGSPLGRYGGPDLDHPDLAQLLSGAAPCTTPTLPPMPPGQLADMQAWLAGGAVGPMPGGMTQLNGSLPQGAAGAFSLNDGLQPYAGNGIPSAPMNQPYRPQQIGGGYGSDSLLRAIFNQGV